MIFDLNLENLPIDAQVKTRKGFIWTHISPDSWKDETSGLIWLPESKEKYNHYKAVERFGPDLPTRNEFEEAEKHGIREIFSMEGECFWSASVHPNYSDVAYDFNGGNGYIGNDNRDYDYDSVRCVSRDGK